MILKVGADPFPPYQYIDEQGIIKGSDYETVNKILVTMGMTASYILDDWSKIEEMLIDRKIDIAFQVQKTPEREKKYLFSNLLRNATTSIISLKQAASLNSINEIVSNNQNIAIIEGYKYGELIDDLPVSVKVNCKNLTEQLKFVTNCEANYAVVDLGVLEWELKHNDFPDIKVVPNVSFNRPLYVVFNDNELRNSFNSFLEKEITLK